MALTIIYDEQCPLCSRYVRMLRLQETVGPVNLLDARQGGPLVEDARKRGYVLDEGMLLIVDDQYYHGHEAMTLIAMMSSHLGWFNRTNRKLFRSPWFAKSVYPAMKAGRRGLLRMLGRKPLGY